MSTGPGRPRRVRPATVAAVAVLALLALTYAVFVPAAWQRVQARGGTPSSATFHGGSCLLGECAVTFSVAGERVTAGLPVGTRAGGHDSGDTVTVRHPPGEPGRAVLADDTGRGSVALLLAAPLGATLAAAAWAVSRARSERRARPAQTF
ncbi:hypothetical protein OQI_07970 [Streptomyces pharetrae CZA14]|uniref:DUF3592 domain-containing protein n=1 Tax=Streptomyces pharetrae CZA14 TaxID=1144883 RepID=A0ABX3YNA2_9ACTN|nr:hypothetical protein OQI_07970 [Streptomyces pharetrae CZA14]